MRYCINETDSDGISHLGAKAAMERCTLSWTETRAEEQQFTMPLNCLRVVAPPCLIAQLFGWVARKTNGCWTTVPRSFDS